MPCDELTTRTTRAINPYTPEGEPVDGGDDAATAVRVEPGQYVDQVVAAGDVTTPAPGTAEFYQVSLEQGQRLHVSATLVRPQAPAGSAFDYQVIGIEPVEAEDGSSCGRPVSDRNNERNLLGGPPTVTFTSAEMGGENEGCYAGPSGEVRFRVVRDGDAAGAELAVELGVYVEQASEPGSSAPAPASTSPLPAPPASGEPVAVSPGYTYGSATPLSPGTYSATLVPDEAHLYKVELDYGQQLAAEVRLGEYATTGGGFALQLNAATPLRSAITLAEGGIGYRKGIPDTSAEPGTAIVGTFASPVRFTNRESSDTSIETLFLAGEYYLMVSSDSQGDEANNIEVPYTLVVDVSGTVEPGPELVGAQPEETPTATATVEEPEAAETTDAALADVNDGEATSAGPQLWVLGGVLLLLVAACALFLVRRRRSS